MSGEETQAEQLGRAQFRWLIGASIALGAALRAAHLAAMRNTPFFDGLILDARAYDAWAQRIAGGQLIGDGAFWIDPLYAYVLGGVYALFGHDLQVPRVLNAAFGLITALLAAGIALRALGSRMAALASCLVVCSFVPAIHFESQVEKTALSVLLVALGIYLFLGGTLRSIALAGVATGLAVLARGNVLLFIPIGALALWRGWDREPGDSTSATEALRRRRATVFAACALPVVGLATAHNVAASGELIPTTSNFGINLYIGNHLENVHGAYTPPPFLLPTTDTEQPDFRAEAERRTGRSLSDRELSSYWAGRALEVIASAPGAAVQRTWRKLRSVLHNDEVPDSEAPELFAHWSKVAGAPLIWFGQLIPVAVLGAMVAFRRRGVRVLVAIAALYAASLLPFFVLARLRMPLLVPLAVLAGAAVASVVRAVDEHRTRELARPLLITAALAFFCFYRPAWMAERTTGGLAIGWHNLGATLEKRGDRAGAARAFERALATDAGAVPGSARALGAYYLAEGDYERAERAWRRLVALKPDSASARAGWRSVAAALLGRGESERAIALLQRAVQEGPYDENLRYLLGQTMERHASPQAMIDFFSSAAAHDDKPQTSHYFWAVGLARSGDVPGALAQLERALEIDPAHEMSQHRIGVLLEQRGELAGALARYEEAARILPEYKAALEDAARLAERLGHSQRAAEHRRRAAIADPSSPRRHVHWARYLHERGRSDAALHELDRMLAQHPGDPEAARLRDQIMAGAKSAPAVDVAQHERIRTMLANAGATAVIKLAHDERYPEARELARALAETFEASGWTARVEPAPFALKPGMTALAASHPPLPTTTAAIEALQGALLPINVRSGYRQYANEMRAANSGWLGFVMADDEDLIIAIGDLAP